MTLLPTGLIGANDDYIEEFRGYWYPKIHPYLKPFGGYATGIVNQQQYVGVVAENEETIEKELQDAGFVRNPIAALKSHTDGRKSEGSWVLISERDDTGVLDSPTRQLHITLLPRQNGEEGRAVFAHNEYDWRDHPIWHLRAKHLKPQKGANQARSLIDAQTFLKLKHLNR